MIKYSTSDPIDSLPIQTEYLNPTEYARIAPLINETIKAVIPLKRYVIMFILFVVISMTLIDSVLEKMFPTLEKFRYLIVFIKALIFVLIVYIIDNIFNKKNKE